MAERCRTFTDPLLGADSTPASGEDGGLVRVLLDAVRKLQEALAAAGTAGAQAEGIDRVLELREACLLLLGREPTGTLPPQQRPGLPG